jgi:predicted HicB family RNase H-like nuclease
MKGEYDFSAAPRGRFYSEGAAMVLPVRLKPEILRFLSERAAAQGASLDGLVNQLLERDIARIKAEGSGP